MIILEGNGLTVQLPSAQLGNSIQLPLRVNARRAMSGERYTYITTPVKAKHVLNFATLNNNQVEEMYVFIKANIGKYIQYNELDVEDMTASPERLNFYRTARILDGAVEFVHRARRDNTFQLNLEVGDYA